MALFAQNGTLAGTLEVTPFASGQPAIYTEVHNLDLTHTHNCTLNGTTFIVPPARKLIINEPVSTLILNGTGEYVVQASNVSTSLPKLEASDAATAIVGGGGVTPDGVTIESVGGIIRVKDLGITAPKLANSSLYFRQVNSGVQASPGVPYGGRVTVAGLPADGETFTVQLGAIFTKTFTWRVAPALPSEVLIGVTVGACAFNLAAALLADAIVPIYLAVTHLVLSSGPAGSVAIVVGTYTEISANTVLSLTGSANVTVEVSPGSGELQTAVVYVNRTVTAAEVTDSAIVIPTPGTPLVWGLWVMRSGLAPIPVPLFLDGPAKVEATGTLVYYDTFGANTPQVGDTLQGVIVVQL